MAKAKKTASAVVSNVSQDSVTQAEPSPAIKQATSETPGKAAKVASAKPADSTPEPAVEKSAGKKSGSTKAGKSAPAKAPVAKPAAKPVKPLLAFGGIDTNLVAQVAARSLTHRVGIPGSNASAASAPSSPQLPVTIAGESSSFKHLKHTLSQPTSTLDKILGPSGQKKDGGSFLTGVGGGSRGQANGGGDAKNVGVPRRTNG